jgi:hypothetical protein
MERSSVMVTGASSGIGLEIARIAAAEGNNVILVARTAQKLEELAAALRREHGVDAHVVACDLSQAGAAGGLAALLEERGLRVDVLVNNAGFGDSGEFLALSEERQRRMIRLNVEELTSLTRLLLARMRERGTGAVLNVASTAAFQPGPGMAVYYATKAYVLYFTEALHEELLGTGLRVTCLCPGPTETGFAAEANAQGSLLFRLGAGSARDVALAGWKGLARNEAVVIPGLMNKLLAFSTRFAPRAANRKIVMRLHAKA